MNSLRKKLFILVLVLFPIFAAASTPAPPAVPRDYVVDLAGIITGDVQNRLNELLLELERKTSAQVLVLTVQSLDGQSIEEFAFNTKEKWRLGQKRKDNGVLIAVSVKDRKYRFEVGYGLEEVLPDSLVGSLGRRYLVPFFKQGDYSSGIFAATVAVIKTIADHEGVEISGMARPPRANEVGHSQPQPVPPFIFGIFLLIVIALFVTHPRQCFLLLLMSSMGSRRGGGWSGGGGGFGGFGGGGGSFGGGGGGSGGGGGASGGW